MLRGVYGVNKTLRAKTTCAMLPLLAQSELLIADSDLN